MKVNISLGNGKTEEFESDDYLVQTNPATGSVTFTSKQDNTETLLFMSCAALPFAVEHDSILQTLDRESNGTYLGKEFFEPTIEEWNSVPLIFAQEHPNVDAWDKDPMTELKRIRGRLVNGTVSRTSIETTGHPRLMAKLNLQDTEIEKGIAEGRISTSNGFRARTKKGALSGPVNPHHILFFYEQGEAIPGDKGVLILNQRIEESGELTFSAAEIEETLKTTKSKGN